MDYSSEAPGGAEFADLPEDMQVTKNYKTWEKEFKEFLYRGQEMEVWKCSSPKTYSEAGETLGDFKIRLETKLSEKRDEAVEKLRAKYATKFTSLRDKIRRAEDKIEVEKDQYRQRKMESKFSMGASILGALLGRKTLSSTNVRRAKSAMTARGRASKERSDIDRAEDKLEDLENKFQDLEVEFRDAVEALEEKMSVDNFCLLYTSTLPTIYSV